MRMLFNSMKIFRTETFYSEFIDIGHKTFVTERSRRRDDVKVPRLAIIRESELSPVSNLGFISTRMLSLFEFFLNFVCVKHNK